ncbi:hypothetical protein [Halopenitus persicus]|uniref:hypothetical protein n=1 Tax=Halopenitus persicus TaxID=1048396 RepID=UPI000BBB260E|nr:hypothetical protein [Halopenitus persicus]
MTDRDMTDRDHDEENPDRTDRPTEATASEPPSDEAWRVTIPDHVGGKIANRLSETDFDSVDEYVTFVLESLLRELAEQDDDVSIAVVTDDDTSENSEAIQGRLESLGYL